MVTGTVPRVCVISTDGASKCGVIFALWSLMDELRSLGQSNRDIHLLHFHLLDILITGSLVVSDSHRLLTQPYSKYNYE